MFQKSQWDLLWLFFLQIYMSRQGKNLLLCGFLTSLLNLATIGAEQPDMILVQVYHVLKNITLGGIYYTFGRRATSHFEMSTLEF